MKLVAIEPTPSPNSLKIVVSPAFSGRGKTYDLAATDTPPLIRQIVEIPGVKSVYAVSDFLAVERHPKYDWRDLTNQIRRLFGETVHDEELKPLTADYEPIHVHIQFLLGIPMQVKLLKGEATHRVGLSKRFVDAALLAQERVQNMIEDRRWVEQAPRYGDIEQVALTVAEEMEASYPEERLQRLLDRAFERAHDLADVDKLTSSDWKERLATIDELEVNEANIEFFVNALQDEKMAVRRQAIVKIGMFEESRERYVTYIEQGLSDRSPIVRRTAGDTISDWGLPQSEPSMIEAIQDKNKLVRWRAARYLYDCGTNHACPALRLAAEDPEFEVALQARLALERIESGETALGTVWQQMMRRER